MTYWKIRIQLDVISLLPYIWSALLIQYFRKFLLSYNEAFVGNSAHLLENLFLFLEIVKYQVIANGDDFDHILNRFSVRH